MKYKLLVFDIDGTLTDSVHIHISSFLKVLKQLGVERQDFNFKTFKHHTDSFVAKAIYESELDKKFTADVFEVFKSMITEEIKKSTIQEINGVNNLFQWINSQENIFVCFATGSIREAAIYKLNQIGIDFLPKQLVTSDEYYSREEIVGNAIKQAEQLFGVQNFDEIIAVGDGLWDLLTAKNLELDFIGVGKDNEQIMRDNGMENFVLDLREISEII